jgi:hypothetical protein
MIPGAALGPPGEYGVLALDERGPLIPVARLREARLALDRLPAKQRHELEALYGEAGRGSAA